jgi:hypothetical protein
VRDREEDAHLSPSIPPGRLRGTNGRARAAEYKGEHMRSIYIALALVCIATAAHGQKAIPNLKGTWSGNGKSIVFGSNPHHPGLQTAADPPRVRDIEVTYIVEGQEGRLAWGSSSSTTADTKEPFAWAMSTDNRSIIGADADATSGSPSCPVTAWKSATHKMAQVRADRLLRRAI